MLPERDEEYLKSKGFKYTLTPSGNEIMLVFPDFPVSSPPHNRCNVDLLVRLPPGYPNANPDMFWVVPELRLANGQHPEAASTFETHLGRQWQRFSRHYKGDQWRAGVDGIWTHLNFIQRELSRN